MSFSVELELGPHRPQPTWKIEPFTSIPLKWKVGRVRVQECTIISPPPHPQHTSSSCRFQSLSLNKQIIQSQAPPVFTPIPAHPFCSPNRVVIQIVQPLIGLNLLPRGPSSRPWNVYLMCSLKSGLFLHTTNWSNKNKKKSSKKNRAPNSH